MSNTTPTATTPTHVVSAKQRLKEFKEANKQKALIMVTETIPERIMELTELLETPDFNLEPKDYRAVINVPVPEVKKEDDESGKKTDCADLGTSTGFKVLLLPNGIVERNKVIERIHSIVKPLVMRLVEDTNVLKMWIHFLIPKVEDGNNFGVGIQEECLSEVSEVQKDGAAYLDQVSRYFMCRAKGVSKIAKYPHVEDFRKHVEELDFKQYLTVRLSAVQLRNDYALIHDVITKNLEKIQTPRSSNVENLY